MSVDLNRTKQTITSRTEFDVSIISDNGNVIDGKVAVLFDSDGDLKLDETELSRIPALERLQVPGALYEEAKAVHEELSSKGFFVQGEP